MIIFGATTATYRLKQMLESEGKHIEAFCDNDPLKQGKECLGLPIIKPTELNEKSEVMISSLWSQTIANQIKALGVTKISTADRYEFPLHFDHKMDFTKIGELYNMLEDNLSKETLRMIVNYRLSLSEIGFSFYDQYFCPNALPFGTLIDGGAFTGDTAVRFLKYCEKIFAFEPVKSVYDSLVQETKGLNKVIPKNYALYDKNGTASISNIDLPGASNLSTVSETANESEGTDIINTIRLDDCIDEKIDVLKLDIEGSEKEALIGATSLIQKYKPRLHICLYHKPADLYDLPLFIKTLNPEYKFYLGHHSENITESVLYAL